MGWGAFAAVGRRSRRLAPPLAALPALGAATACAGGAQGPLAALPGAALWLSPTGAALAALAAVAIGAVAFRCASRRAAAPKRPHGVEAELARTKARLERSEFILASEPQVLVAWNTPDADPSIEGDGVRIADAPKGMKLLNFRSWLEPALADNIDAATERLKQRGESFAFTGATLGGRYLELTGQPVSGSAVLRIREVSGDRLELARLRKDFADAEGELSALRKALEAAGLPAWRRNAEGGLVWCNGPFARAAEAPDESAVIPEGDELFDLSVRREAAAALRAAGAWRSRASAVVDGERRTFETAEILAAEGSAGVAFDVSELAVLRAELERNEDDYSRMIDRLSTAVAIFDKSKRLTFYNAAYRQIWSLEPAFLDQQPTDGEVLERLRAKRLLPEQADFRQWKAQQMEAYQTIEPSETVWHLPDGRALRVVTSPNPKGGVTHLYDDATQSFALASQVNALTRVQGETLDALKEGVATFGADGRMKLVNPVFAEMWRLDPARLVDRPHIDEISDACRALCQDPARWDELRAMVVGLSERREGGSARIVRTDGLALDCAALPLPDGATLLTSLDVTAGVNIERALTERNEALIAAEKLRNDFVNHVSYELRTPLTNIIGFTQLLAAGGVGPLNPKQLEYAGFITNSSHALLAIIDDILDLASIDAGALELRLETVDVAEAMRAAAAGVHDRLDEAAIEVRMVVTDGVGTMHADGRRIRQVLFNLLSNAINYSEAGQTVTLAAMQRGAEIVFKVSDRGRGIPPEMVDRVFERFETFPNGSRHRGPGLGLSIVKELVELHGGRVLIDTAPGEGTTVTCIFPIDPAQVRQQAREQPESVPVAARRALRPAR
jgi:signal transduction histidine kinase